MSDKQATLWASVLRANKALRAGAAVFASFVGATLAANGGHDLTWQQWAQAAGAFLLAHVFVYQATNAPAKTDPVVVPADPVPVALAVPAAPIVIADTSPTVPVRPADPVPIPGDVAALAFPNDPAGAHAAA